METRKVQMKMVPPDGGWGWLIVLGSSLINFSTRSIEPSFGLIFGDLLKQLGIETTGAAMVLSLLCSVVNFSGLVVGPLIKKYTYRKVAIFAALTSTTAILLTVPANSLMHLMITFGGIGGFGFGLGYACTLVGINSYFSKRIGQAVGLSMTGTAVGFMLMPQIVRLLLSEYDFRSTLLILGAISLHATVGASLFQPVSWHMKALMVEPEEQEAHTNLLTDKKNSSAPKENTVGVRHNMSCPNLECGNKFSSQEFSKRESLISNIFFFGGEGNILKIQANTEEECDKKIKNGTINSYGEESYVKKEHKKSRNKSEKNCFSRVIKLMDLNLLRDGVYLNIIFELTILEVVEMNIKLILPFFLLNLGFTLYEISYALSSMAVTDMFVRIIVPPILDRIKITRRATFMITCIFVAIGRSILAFQTTIGSVITTLAIIGFIRGINLTSFPLVLTEYSAGKEFPSVLGLCMACRGITVAILGPVCGYIRDVSGSYTLFIHCQTALMALVFIAWILEIIILKYKKKKVTEKY